MKTANRNINREIPVEGPSPATMIRPVYQLFKPDGNGNFGQQWETCFARLEQYRSDHPDRKAFILRVFTGSGHEDEFRQRSRLIKAALSDLNIPFSVLCQRPAGPYEVTMEAGFADTRSVRVSYHRAASLRFSKLTANGYAEYWFAGVEGAGETEKIAGTGETGEAREESGKRGIFPSASARATAGGDEECSKKNEGCSGDAVSICSENAFDRLQQAFREEGTGFNDLVRQWNYIGHILRLHGTDRLPRQNYQLFNEVRGRYYSRYRTVPGFPSATGIGVNAGGVTIECLLIKAGENLRVVSVGNPRQVHSYQYGQTVLKGEPPKDKKTKQTPLFERAKLITDGKSARIFISGTASIIGQETIGKGNVEEQTRVTINNIELLTGKTNLVNHCPGLTVFPERYAYVRVYVKNEADFPVVQTICREHFGEVPVNFVQADICRTELLVEIEAEKIS